MKKFVIAVIFSMLLSGCSPAVSEASVSFLSMDTFMNITVFGPDAEENAKAAEARIRELESLFSITVPDSDISRINAAGNAGCAVSDETIELINLSIEYAALTGGAFDITVGALMDAWGFAGNKDFRVPGGGEIASLLSLVGSDRIKISGNTVSLTQSGMILDAGGAGKGYAGEEAAGLLRQSGVTSALLSLGGNIVCIGAKPDGEPWRVAVQAPDGGEGHIGVLELIDTCAVTTGGYRRFYEQDGVLYHHVLDPETGLPSDSGIVSATIIHPNSAIADMLSTAVFVLGEERATALWSELGSFDMVLLTSSGKALVTPGIADAFTPAPGYEPEITG